MEKILVLQNCILLNNSISGGDVIMPKMFPYLKKKYDIHVIGNVLTKSIWMTYNANASFHLYQNSRIDSSQLLVFGPLKYIFRTIQSTHILLSLMKKNKGRIFIYSSSDYFPDTIPAFIAKLLYPHIFWVGRIYHLIPVPWRRKSPFFYTLFSLFSQRLSFVLLKRKVNKIFILKNAFGDIKKFFPPHILEKVSIGSPVPTEKKIQPQFDAVSIGTIIQNRGSFDLISIWQIVTKEKSKAKLAIIGGGPDKNIQKLTQKIRQLHLKGNVIYFGSVNQKRLFSILSRSRLHLSTRIEGGSSLPALEAASLGIPSIAYKTQAFGKNFPGSILIQKGNFQLFAKNILSLLKNKQLYKNLSTEADKNATINTWKKISTEFQHSLTCLEYIKK